MAIEYILNPMKMNGRVEWCVIVHFNLFTVRNGGHRHRVFSPYSHIITLISIQRRPWKPVIDKNQFSLHAIWRPKRPGQVQSVMDLGSPGKWCHKKAKTSEGHHCSKSDWIQGRAMSKNARVSKLTDTSRNLECLAFYKYSCTGRPYRPSSLIVPMLNPEIQPKAINNLSR